MFTVHWFVAFTQWFDQVGTFLWHPVYLFFHHYHHFFHHIVSHVSVDITIKFTIWSHKNFTYIFINWKLVSPSKCTLCCCVVPLFNTFVELVFRNAFTILATCLSMQFSFLGKSKSHKVPNPVSKADSPTLRFVFLSEKGRMVIASLSVKLKKKIKHEPFTWQSL